MDFTIKTLATLDIAGFEIYITETMVNTWIIMAVMIAFAIFVRIKMRKFTAVPKGLQNVVEAVIEMFDNLVRESSSERLMYLGNWFFAVFFFLILSNLSGLIGMRPPTADFITTFAFALASFIIIQVVALRWRKGAYIKSFFEPNVIFFPLNLIGELARPISLSFRMFGNVLSGMILMSLYYGLMPMITRFLIPAPLHAFFDLFSGALQAYIFCVLSLSFIEAASVADDI